MRNVNIKGTNVELTNEIREDVSKCLDSIKKFLEAMDGEIVGQVEVGQISTHHKSGNIFRAEINLEVKGQTLYAVSEKPDLKTALDYVRDDIVGEAKKMKGKQRSLVRRGGQKMKSIIRGFFNKE